MLDECKIAFSKKKVIISDSFSNKVQHLLPPDRWPLMSVNAFTISTAVCLILWKLLLQTMLTGWMTSIRGHICGLKVKDNQFVTYISSSSQSLSSIASFPFFFLLPSSHSTFSSHLHLLPLQKKAVLPWWLLWRIQLQEEEGGLKPLKCFLMYGWET